MELLILVLAVLAIVIATSYRREYMTNKDVMSAIQKYGTETPSKDKKKSPVEAPIMGPKAEPPVDPKPTSGNGKTDKSSGVYPDIYGPDVVSPPGTKPKSSKHESDNVEDDTYDYNPDLQKAFPTSGPPQPFLGSFAAFQK